MPRFQGIPVDEEKKPRFSGVPVESADQPSTLSDVAQSLGTGIRQGAEGTLGLPGDIGGLMGNIMAKAGSMAGAGEDTQDKLREIGSYVGLGGPNVSKIFGTTAEEVGLPSDLYPSTTKELHAMTTKVIGDNYQPQTTSGEVARTVGEFLPGAFVGEGTLAERGLTQALLPALASEGAGRFTKRFLGAKYEPYARIAAALMTPVAAAGVGRMITPFEADPERIRMADTLAGEGVDLTAGQRTGSERLRYMESELGGMGAQAFSTKQGEQFTRAALAKAGIDADRATQPVMDQAFTRIGNEFDNMASSTDIPFDQQLQDDLLQSVVDYNENTGPSARAPLIENIMNDAASMAKQGSLGGSAYQRLRTRITDAMRTGDSNTHDALMDMREALDDAVQRHLPTDLADRWQEARRQYRNMIVLEKAATSAGEQARAGIISPSALRAATVSGHGRRNFLRGRGDFADFANAGEGVMKPLPNSGTSARIKASNLGQTILSGLGGIAGYGGGGVPGAIAGTLAGGAVPPLVGALMLSRAGRAYLGNQLMTQLDRPDPRMSALIDALLASRHDSTPAIAP